MSDDQANGRATIREVRDLIQALDDKMDDRFSTLSHELEERYVLRAACRERSHVSLTDITTITDERYASKATERVVDVLTATVLIAVIGTVLRVSGIF